MSQATTIFHYRVHARIYRVILQGQRAVHKQIEQLRHSSAKGLENEVYIGGGGGVKEIA